MTCPKATGQVNSLCRKIDFIYCLRNVKAFKKLVQSILKPIKKITTELHRILRTINPLVTNGLANYNYLDDTIFISRCIRCDSKFLLNFPIKQNSSRRDVQFCRSNLGLFCLPKSLIKDTRLILVNARHFTHI